MTTVLIVDDHSSFRRSARALLELEGYDVVGEAADGASALSAAAALEPDLVLLDVQLPDIDGFTVASQLARGNGTLPSIVLTSSRDAVDYGPLIAESGATGFVPKSELSAEALETLIDR